MSATTNRFPKITEDGLTDLRKRIGVKITDTIEPWNHEATRDAIRHYAHGIGDVNPLWTDPAYAQKTKYGAIVALPSFLFSTSRIVSGYCGGLSGVNAMWAGADWTWHKPVLRNDVISTEACLKDLIEHQTRFAGRSFQQIYHVDFFNQHGDRVAEADSWVFRTDRDEARERGTKYTGVRGKVEPFTDEQLLGILTAARPGSMLQQQERGRSLASDPMPLARSMNERSPIRASSHALVTKAAGMVRIRRRVAQRPICEFLL